MSLFTKGIKWANLTTPDTNLIIMTQRETQDTVFVGPAELWKQLIDELHHIQHEDISGKLITKIKENKLHETGGRVALTQEEIQMVREAHAEYRKQELTPSSGETGEKIPKELRNRIGSHQKITTQLMGFGSRQPVECE